MVACLLYLRSSSADPLLFLCTKLKPNSNQTRCKFELALLFYRLWFEFGSNLLRVCNGFTAEDEQRYSRLTSDLLQCVLIAYDNQLLEL